jgi:cobalamin biosynthesis Mg chelatase CobN
MHLQIMKCWVGGQRHAPIGSNMLSYALDHAGKSVGCSVVEAFGDNPKPQELEQVLRLEYRSKLLNPKVAGALDLQI